MSADAWSVCPACAIVREETIEFSARQIEESYGKVSVETFDKMREDHCRLLEGPRRKNTLREDYEFYRDGFILYISYHAECSECGFKQVYRNEVDSRS